jgi:hypothetical protein
MTEFKLIMNRLTQSLGDIPYDNGDVSDIGNEIGIVLGEFITTESELKDFIHGVRHGISLTNGTH